MCDHDAATTDNNKSCRDLQTKFPHGSVRKKRSQTTSRVGVTDVGSAQTRRRGGRAGEEGCVALTFSVDPGLSRSSSLHKTTPSLRELCRKASGSEMVFFGDSSTPSVINHVTVCSAEFMSSHGRSCSTKRRCLGISSSSPPWLRCHLCVRRQTLLIPRGREEKKKDAGGEVEREAAGNPVYLCGMRMMTTAWWRSASLVSSLQRSVPPTPV